MADEAKPTDAAAAAAAAAAPAAPAKGKGMLPILVAVVVCIAGAVTVGIVAFPEPPATESHDEAGAPPKKKEPSDIFQAPIPKILVNLAEDTRGNRILQAEITLEMLVVDPVAAQSEFNKLLPKVQDKLIAVLSSYSATDLEGSQSKDMAKVRLKDEMNRDLFSDTDMKVGKILFTEFVVQ